MTLTIQKTKKIGGSLMVTIPHDIVQREHITEGENIQIEIKKVKKNCFGLLPNLPAWKKEDKYDVKETIRY